MKKVIAVVLCLLITASTTLAAFVCTDSESLVNELKLDSSKKDASSHTKQVNNAVYKQLDFDDKSEWENATKGLIEAPKTLEIKDKNGNVVWSQKAYDFLDKYEQAPATVNPSLWENSKNNHAYGLFKVIDGIYQVRGYDLTNLTVVSGDTGYIIFDPMMSVECTQAAMELVYKNLGKKPIKAVIISHSHADHFGGIKGVMSDKQRADAGLSIADQLTSGKIPVIVPQGYEEHAVSENLLAGVAMRRRANYQYGTFLKEDVKGTVAMGIGMAQSSGLSSYISPTYEITKAIEKITIDGVVFEFQLTPGTEAPAEMNTWVADYNALWMAENCTGTLHNLYTLRGAQVRDGEIWAKYITDAITRYGKKAQVVFQSHNWPHWGNKNINEYMTNTAAVYKYINDQTLVYINLGYTSEEIANMIQLPPQLDRVWYTRQYYGTVAHNSRAVYQKYMGFYDANPVNLKPLPISESAKKWVEYLKDTDEVLRKAKKDFDNGEYQWVAEITNILVFADPNNKAARLLCADALEQLGYQSESGTWRNVYLSAALELRMGNQAKYSKDAVSSGDAQKSISAECMLQYMAIMLNREKMQGENFKMNISVTDTKQQFGVNIVDGVMLIYENTQLDDAQVSIKCPKVLLFAMVNQNKEAIAENMVIDGDKSKVDLLVENMNSFNTTTDAYFNIIEP